MNDQRPERRRFQFGLRRLLLWTAVVALYLSVLSLVRFEPCISVSATLYLMLVGVVRVRFGRRAGCVCSAAVLLVPLLCLAALGIIGEAVSGSIGPREAALWAWGVLFGLGACCVLGFLVFAFVELVLCVVDWPDKSLETKAAGKTRRDEELKRRWYQFSLRTLLAFVLIASIGMSWLVVKLQRARKQRGAVQAIEKAGGSVWYASGYGPDDDPFSIPPPAPAGLRRFLGEHLFLKVRAVNFYGTRATDATLEHLEGLINLRSLVLIGTQVTDAGLEHLKGLGDLEWLYLNGTQVTDAGLEHLKGMTSLRELDLSDTQVTDAGLEHLKGTTKLKSLYLNETQVTDAGLEHVKGLTNLQWLDLSGTQVSDAGVDDLRKALPNCCIVHRPTAHVAP